MLAFIRKLFGIHPPDGWVNVHLYGCPTKHKDRTEADRNGDLAEWYDENPRIACVSYRNGQGLGR